PPLPRPGLPPDGAGARRTDATLRSTGDSAIFGGGDCIAFDGQALPRIGVYAVREAPVLLHNLGAALDGMPLRTYRPQRRAVVILDRGRAARLAQVGPCARRR